MLHKVYSVRDAKSNSYNQPFHQTTHGEAERSFHRMTNDEKSFINAYPDDFDLYYLGEFDTIKGLYQPLKSPEHIMKAVQVLERKGLHPVTSPSSTEQRERIAAMQQ